MDRADIFECWNGRIESPYGVAPLATVAALWGWLRPAPVPRVTRLSLLLPAAEALKPATQVPLTLPKRAL